MFCPKCDKTQLVKTIERQETLPVRDAKISVLSQLNVCSVCKEEFATTEQEEENVRKAYDEYRKQKGLLTHSEVRDVRVQYGLSQTAFSRWLGWAILRSIATSREACRTPSITRRCFCSGTQGTRRSFWR